VFVQHGGRVKHIPLLVCLDGTFAVDRLTEHVNDTANKIFAHRCHDIARFNDANRAHMERRWVALHNHDVVFEYLVHIPPRLVVKANPLVNGSRLRALDFKHVRVDPNDLPDRIARVNQRFKLTGFHAAPPTLLRAVRGSF